MGVVSGAFTCAGTLHVDSTVPMKIPLPASRLYSTMSWRVPCVPISRPLMRGAERVFEGKAWSWARVSADVTDTHKISVSKVISHFNANLRRENKFRSLPN